MPPHSILKEDVFHKTTTYSLEKFFLPPFLLGEDVINDTPSQEIILEILHHDIMVMSGSQPIPPMLFQVEPYPPLEENDEHNEREISSTTEDVPDLIIEDAMDDASIHYEDNNQMIQYLKYLYMEPIDDDTGKMKNVENINLDPLMEHV